MATLYSNRRPCYFDDMVLGIDDLLAERTYLDGQRGLYNGRLHDWGIADGLDVTVDADKLTMTVSPGFAVTPAGGEIVVPAPMTLPAPSLAGQPTDRFNLFVRPDAALTDSSLQSQVFGYKKIAHQAVFSFIPNGDSDGDDAVFLARIRLDAAGAIAETELDARRYCGFDAKSVTFVDPSGDAAARLAVAAVADGGALGIAAAGLQIDGSFGIAGSLAIGAVHPRATLDIEGIATTLLSVRDLNGAPALTVRGAGLTGIGTDLPTARLTIQGDIGLDAGQAIRFDGAGALAARDDSCRIDLAGGGAPLRLSAPRIAFFTDKAPAVMTAAAGRVGIGTDTPDEALTVQGPVQSLTGGFEFGDGAIQRTAGGATTVCIGTILDWWPGGGTVLPPEFMICDGSTVKDDKSPLKNAVLPDLRGRYVRGAADLAGIGQTGGASEHDHEVPVLASHTHPISHAHAGTGHTTADAGTGQGAASGTDCSALAHDHEVDLSLDPCAEAATAPNAPSRAPTTAAKIDNQPSSMALMKIIRIR